MTRFLAAEQYMRIQDELNEFTVPEWKNVLTRNNFKVAMFDEFAELLNSGSWKWWKAGNEPNKFNLQMEAIDILHFSLSIDILNKMDNRQTLPRDAVIGYGNNEHMSMVNYQNMIDHNVFISNAMSIINTESPTMAINNLFNSLGMDDELVSALYTAKSELNYIRQEDGYKDGTYVKVKDGIEDNERMKSVINEFIDNKQMDLDELRTRVRKHFFQRTKP